MCGQDQTPAANYANVCTAIEILTYLLSVLPQQTILTLFKPLQRGIATCMTCQTPRGHPCYPHTSGQIDDVVSSGIRLMNPFFKALQRMHKDHINAVSWRKHRDETLVSTELASKLEPAFLSGLRCNPTTDPIKIHGEEAVRSTTLHFCSQNWEAMGPHFWIKQCIELLLAVSACERPVTPSSTFSMLPSVTSYLRAADKPTDKRPLSQRKVKKKKWRQTAVLQRTRKTKITALCLFEIEDSEKLLTAMDKTGHPSRLKEIETVQLLAEKHGKFIDKLREAKDCVIPGSNGTAVPQELQPRSYRVGRPVPSIVESADRENNNKFSLVRSVHSCAVEVIWFKWTLFPVLFTLCWRVCPNATPLFPSDLVFSSILVKLITRGIVQDSCLRITPVCVKTIPIIRFHISSKQVIDFSPFEEDPSEINQHETLDALAEMYSLLNEEGHVGWLVAAALSVP
ncbi:hypothetical protein OS493_030524 [Desmophyllum pertusum]|uniref:Uncharacterized protein n=1 Tax=Desmophyllum pertusum TaxID=174260 RepID=A0A9X0CK23_9CNID|nr:hypothetical protein OS493_030524 [Desmophyllum pertusum]